MKLLQRTDIAGDSIRFAAAGLINTGLTILAFQVLLYFTSSQLSYVFSWIIGLIFVLFVYPDRVFFGGRTDYVSRIFLIIIYLALFFMGLTLMNLIDLLGIPSRLSIFIVVGCTTLANFFASRFWLRRG